MATRKTDNNADTKKLPDEQTTPEVKQPLIPKDIDPNMFVTVINGFQGRLCFKSKRTGEKFVWGQFGDEQEIELRDLKAAKNSAKKFFENNWFMFEEPWIPEYLGVGRYYKYAIDIDHFDDIFKMIPAEAKKIIQQLSKGQKQSIVYRAKNLIADGAIDSLKLIAALEDALGTELIEKM